MKTIFTFILTISFACNLVVAQDTIYVYKAGVLIKKQALTDIDSVTFHKDYDNTNQETVTDIDGNVYHTIKIGTQTWMVENLKTTKYRNGDAIPNVTDNDAWHNLTSGAYCNYNNDANNAIIYGRLYNWYTVSDTRNIAPVGWHVPTDAEWTVLITYLANNGYGSWRSNNEVGKSLAATSYWALSDNGETTIGNDLTKNNKSGFTALPGGCRDDTGLFQDITYSGFWWTSSPIWNEAWYRSMYYYDGYVFKEYDYKVSGYSVRCIKDQ